MTSLFGRRYVTFHPARKAQFLTCTQLYCTCSKINRTSISEYEINEQVLLSAENRERCLEKMSQTPKVVMKSRRAKKDSKLAAVLIALCTNNEMEKISLLYTRRSHLLSRHMRQISFPGGIKEDEEDFVQCALRETQEEVGIPSNRFEVWGTGSLITPPHTAAIMPVIAVIKNFNVGELKLNKAEVEEAFAIPIERLASPKALRYTQFKAGYSSPVFIVDDKRIWGITGFITNIFLNCFLPPKLNKLQNRVRFLKPFKCGSFT